jgi:hypothetical protein
MNVAYHTFIAIQNLLRYSFLLRLRKCFQCKFEKQWSKIVQISDKMRTYRLFKNVFKFEKYVSVVNSDTDRVSMTRFRTSNHKLQIEIGRYTIPKTPINDRTCKNLKEQVIICLF